MYISELVKRVIMAEERKMTFREIFDTAKKMGLWRSCCRGISPEQKERNLANYLCTSKKIVKDESRPKKYGYAKAHCPLKDRKDWNGNGKGTERCPCSHLPRQSVNRQEIWEHHFGGRKKVLCPYCKEKKHGKKNTITIDTCHMGHKISHCKCGKTSKKNLIPICEDCNHEMHIRSETEFKKILAGK